MKRFHAAIGLGLGVGVGVVTMGCAGAGSADEVVGSSEGAALTATTKTMTTAPTRDDIVVASVRTRADTLVSFVKGADDELGMEIIGTTGRNDADLESAKAAAGGDPIALFEGLAGTPAPSALKDAVTQSSRDGSFALASDEGETQGASQDPQGQLVGSPNPLAVGSNFCDITNDAYSGSGKFEYCWPNQYGEPWVKRKADHMSCRFDVVDGPIRVRYRYKTSSGWHTSIDIWLNDGQYMQRNGLYKYSQRWRECKTVDNPYNRQHHFRVVGHDYLSALPFNPVVVSFPWP